MPNDEQNPTELNTVTGAVNPSEHSEGSNGEGARDLEEKEQADEEHGSAQTSNYQATLDVSSGNIASVVGDNPRVTINYYIQMLHEAERRSLHNDEEISSQKRSVPVGSSEQNTPLQDKYIDNLEFERQNATFFASTKTEETQLPNTDEQISQWYYELNKYEQCYVQATAVLHGAPAHEISKRAENLYHTIYESVERERASLLSSSEEGDKPPLVSARAIDLPSQRKPGRELRANTHTLIRRVNGVERLFWKDIDERGLSAFGLDLLVFLADEFTNYGQQGESFLETLHTWSTENNEECSWRSARAYGVVLCYQHAGELRRVAEKWAKTRNFPFRRRIASLLDGAYEIDYKLNDDQANDPSTSPVLQLLDNWTQRVNKQLDTSTSNLGCAAANTYGLIGKRLPDIALSGLARLLQLPESKATDDANEVFVAGVSTYVSLIWSGHIRKVLDNLSGIADKLSHQRYLPKTIEERQKYRQQRDVRMNAVFEAFFLIAAVSYVESRDNLLTFYTVTDPLPLQPAIPDLHRRDVLLAGVLAKQESTWQEHLITLLCAAIIERRSVSAFDLLRNWATIVLRMQEQDISFAEQVSTQFRQFIVNLGKTIERWCYDIEHHDIEQGLRRSPKAIEAYKYRLEQWQKPRRSHEHPLLDTLVQEILKQFSKESASVRR